MHAQLLLEDRKLLASPRVLLCPHPFLSLEAGRKKPAPTDGQPHGSSVPLGRPDATLPLLLCCGLAANGHQDRFGVVERVSGLQKGNSEIW
jgi:hypothetical protein